MPAMAAEAEYDHNILLKNLVPLNALSDDHLGQLISRLTIERAGDGEFLFREGDTDHHHVYLLEGRVTLLSGTREVDVVQSGTKTARFALAHHWPRKFSARAKGEVRFVRIESRLISELLVRTQSQSYRVSELDGETDGDWMTQVLRSRVLQQIPPSNIQNVLRRMEEVNISADEVVIRQGEKGDYYYVIVRGTGVVTHTGPAGERQVAVLGPGDGFGEEALVSEGIRSSTVSMVSDGMLMRLRKEDFVELIGRSLLRSVKMEAAKTLIEQGASWVDIRSLEDYAANHLPGALHLPLDTLRERCTDYVFETSYIVYGKHFNDSAVGAFLLRARGFDAWVLEGGITDQEITSFSQEGKKGSGSETAVEPQSPSAEEATKPPPKQGQSLEQQIQELKSRYHRALHQRVAEIHQLRQMLEAANADRQRLEKALQMARKENATLRSKTTGGDAQLEQRIAELQQELDDVQEILQEASAQESSSHWERLRIQSMLTSTEQALAEQREINRVLREENEATMRRLEVMQRELLQAEGGQQSE